MKRMILLFFLIFFVLTPLTGVGAEKVTPPEKLSDLYRFFIQSTREVLGAEVKVKPIRILGRSWVIIPSGKFHEVELTLSEFHLQDLFFESGNILFKRLSIDSEALAAWKMKVMDVRETETRLIFSIRSLQEKLKKYNGGENYVLRTDISAQQLEVSGKGHFLKIPMTFKVKAKLKWDEEKMQLFMVPVQVSWAGITMPSWLWWGGDGALPEGPILDLKESWIPFNFQETHVAWDHITLSTNW